jgi:hypothetical protein
MAMHSSCLLLDANVVIYLFKCGIWDKLVRSLLFTMLEPSWVKRTST